MFLYGTWTVKGFIVKQQTKRFPPAKGAPAKRVRDCFAIISCYPQIGSIVYTIPPSFAAQNPPPFAQGRLKVGEKYAPPLHRGGSGIDFRLPLLGEPKSQYKEKAPLQKGAFSLLILIHANGNGLRAHGMITQCYIFFSMRCYAVFRHGI